MKLYHITENDVKLAIDQGRREISHSGKISIIHDVGGKFKSRPNPLTLSVVGCGGGGPTPLANQLCW